MLLVGTAALLIARLLLMIEIFVGIIADGRKFPPTRLYGEIWGSTATHDNNNGKGIIRTRNADFLAAFAHIPRSEAGASPMLRGAKEAAAREKLPLCDRC
ncbi:unnamed protein product [Gongylonema pulchrum]|uniref:Secreted protein n=1 Tax=Gongylonema pulchrum TaxID=637853 RepID=A0A183EJL3_9BILA|nr:unnamed protein product [Gongylonema pulchrum]